MSVVNPSAKLATAVRARSSAVLLGVALSAVASAAPADPLEERWYRIEVAVFAQEIEASAARPVELAALRYPRPAAALAPASPGSRLGLALAPPLAADLPPRVVSNLPPPAWFAGPCVLPAWPGAAGRRPDPCLPAPEADLEAAFPDPPFSNWPDYPPTRVLAALRQPGPRTPSAAVAADDAGVDAALRSDLAAHEARLRRGSYVWQYRAPNLDRHLARLGAHRRIILAGSWHQALPPRGAPRRLVLQAGPRDASRRHPLEGTLAATVGRYVHLAAHLQWRLADGGIAVLIERRRLRSNELHYLDHPAFGVLAHVQPLPLPKDLQRRIDVFERDAR